MGELFLEGWYLQSLSYSPVTWQSQGLHDKTELNFPIRDTGRTQKTGLTESSITKRHRFQRNKRCSSIDILQSPPISPILALVLLFTLSFSGESSLSRGTARKSHEFLFSLQEKWNLHSFPCKSHLGEFSTHESANSNLHHECLQIVLKLDRVKYSLVLCWLSGTTPRGHIQL